MDSTTDFSDPFLLSPYPVNDSISNANNIPDKETTVITHVPEETYINPKKHEFQENEPLSQQQDPPRRVSLRAKKPNVRYKDYFCGLATSTQNYTTPHPLHSYLFYKKSSNSHCSFVFLSLLILSPSPIKRSLLKTVGRMP